MLIMIFCCYGCCCCCCFFLMIFLLLLEKSAVLCAYMLSVKKEMNWNNNCKNQINNKLKFKPFFFFGFMLLIWIRKEQCILLGSLVKLVTQFFSSVTQFNHGNVHVIELIAVQALHGQPFNASPVPKPKKKSKNEWVQLKLELSNALSNHMVLWPG